MHAEKRGKGKGRKEDDDNNDDDDENGFSRSCLLVAG